MGEVRILSAADVRKALPMKAAIAGMKHAYRLFSSGEAQVPLRARVDIPTRDGVALFMPAYIPASEALAVKAVSVFPHNAGQEEPVVYASVLVLSAATGQPLALLEGTSLTAIRTGAGAGAATDALARPDSRVLAMLGSGVQARAGVAAVCAVRPIEEVRVYSPNPAHAAAMAAEVAGRDDIPAAVRPVDSPSAAVHGADIIYAATTSSRPVFDGRDVKPGAHINGVGSFTPTMQEIDPFTVAASLVVVDGQEAALAEAGDLIIPLQDGTISPSHIAAEIGQVLGGGHPGRTADAQITFFKSVGLAVQDAAAAAIALDNARREGLGQLVNF